MRGKRGEFLIAPLPMVNPTLENGLAFAVGYLYRVDATDTMTAPSVSAIGGFKTSNGSWGGMVFQSLRLAHDRFRFMGVFGYSDLNYAFYGIGEDAGAADSPIELNQTGPVGVVDGLCGCVTTGMSARVISSCICASRSGNAERRAGNPG